MDVRLLVQVVTVLANVVKLGSKKGHFIEKLGIRDPFIMVYYRQVFVLG